MHTIRISDSVGKLVERESELFFVEDLPAELLDEIRPGMTLHLLDDDVELFRFRRHDVVAELELAVYSMACERWKNQTSYDQLDALQLLVQNSQCEEHFRALLRIAHASNGASYSVWSSFIALYLMRLPPTRRADGRVIQMSKKFWEYRRIDEEGEFARLLAHFADDAEALAIVVEYLKSADQELDPSERRKRLKSKRSIVEDRQLMELLTESAPELAKERQRIIRDYYRHVEPDHPDLKCRRCRAKADSPFEMGDICPSCNAEKGCDDHLF